jgi:hypothetical protein
MNESTPGTRLLDCSAPRPALVRRLLANPATRAQRGDVASGIAAARRGPNAKCTPADLTVGADA